MKTEEQIRVIELLLKRLDDGTNVDAGGLRRNPSEVYTSRDLAAREWTTFFREHPQVVGMSADLPEPGAFLTTNDFGTPVLATRDQAGSFRAFLNVCRHRGVHLEDEASGTRERFSCPFHGWTYANDGALVAVPKPEHFGNVDRSCLGLIALPAEERHGLLWVHPKPDGVLDVSALLGEKLEEELDAWGWDGLTSIGSDAYEMRMNWKLGIDTFGETYHFKVLHRNSLAANLYGNVQTYDTYGRNHRMGLCFRSIDGLRGVPKDEWHISQAMLPVYYLFPNVQVNVLQHSVVLVRIYPDPGDPARSVSRVSFYTRPAALEMMPDLAMFLRQNFGHVIRDEDFQMAARQQIGADSGANEYVIFGRNEPALHHYHDTYREALGMPPLEWVEES